MSHRWLYSSHHRRRQHLLRSRSPVKIPPQPFLNIDPCQLFHPSTTWRLVVHQPALNDQRRICHTYDMGEKRCRVQQSKIPGGVGGPGACAAVRNASGLLLSALQAPPTAPAAAAAAPTITVLRSKCQLFNPSIFHCSFKSAS